MLFIFFVTEQTANLKLKTQPKQVRRLEGFLETNAQALLLAVSVKKKKMFYGTDTRFARISGSNLHLFLLFFCFFHSGF